MIPLRKLTTCYAALAGFLSLQAAPPLARLIPDSAAIVVTFHDVPSLVAATEESPMARMWRDPQIARFFAPLKEQMKWEEGFADFKARTGYTVSEFFALAKGEAAFVITDLEFSLDPTKATQPPMYFVVDFDDNAAKIESLLTDATQRQVEQGKVKAETETYAGFTLRSVIPVEKETDAGDDAKDGPGAGKKQKSVPLYWTSAEGLVLGSADKDTLTAQIDALKKGGVDSPIERSPHYLRVIERTGKPHYTALIHVPAILPTLQKAIAEKNEGQKPNPMGIDPSQILGALGIDAWETLYLTGHSDPASSVSHYGLTFTEERGILKMFQLGDGVFPRPAWIPAKWDTVATARFSLKQFFAGLEETLRAVSPALEGMMQGQLMQFGKQMNVDIKRDLFGSFGDELVQAQFLGRPGTGDAPSLMKSEQFYAFSVTNAPALTRVLDALLALGGPTAEKMLQRRDYLGKTIVGFTPPPGPDGKPVPGAQGFAYAVSDRYLFLSIGSAAPVEAVLQSLANPGDSFWDKPETRRALAEVPEDASSFQSQNVSILISALFETLVTLSKPPPQPAGNGQERKAWVEASEKPSLEVIERYWGDAVTYTQRDATGIHAVAKMTSPQP